MGTVRIKLSGCIRFILIGLMVINLNLLAFGDYFQAFRYITSAASIILFLLCIFNSKIRRVIRKFRYYNGWLFLITGLMIIEVIIGLMGREGPSEAIGKAHIFTWLLLFYPITYVSVKTKNGVQVLLKDIVFWTVIAYLLKIVVWWLFNYRGIDIMHYVLYEFGKVWLRNGLQRIPPPLFGGILFSAAVFKILQQYRLIKKIPSILMLLMVAFYANNVYASRAQLICFAGATVITIILHRSKGQVKVAEFAGIIATVFIVLMSSVFQEFIEGLSFTTSSMGNRLVAFEHFNSLLKGHLLLGFQHVYSGETINGPLGIAYLSDTGLLENLYCWGVIGFIITIIPFIRMFKICFDRKIRNNQMFPFLLHLFLYTLFSSVLSNNIYDSIRLFALPFICSIFEVVKVQQNID